MAVSTMPLCPLSCVTVAMSVEESFPMWMMFAGPLAAIGFGAEFVRRSASVSSYRDGRLRRLLQEYGDVNGWIVNLNVYQGAALTGNDWGVVWFEEDRLFFTGHRTSFGLFAGDVGGPLLESWTIDETRSSLTLELRETSAAGRVSIGFDVVAGENLLPFRAKLVESIRGWLASGGTQEGETPPLTIGPDAPSHRRLLARALFASGFWCTAVLGLAWQFWLLPWWSLWLVAPVAAFASFCPEVWRPGLRWRAWRDQRRLDLQARQNRA